MKKYLIVALLMLSSLSPAFVCAKAKSSLQTQFIASMLPLAQKANHLILNQRERLNSLKAILHNGGKLSANSRDWVIKLAKRYKVTADKSITSNEIDKLLKHVDIIPPSLVIAQAANESSWGRSRFATEANNYFGMHCQSPGCGIMPKARDQQHSFEVAKYPSVQESVNDYMQNLNSNAAYAALRHHRITLRQQKQAITGRALATGLNRYSIKGHTYVSIIESIIQKYQLTKYDFVHGH